MKNEQGYVQIIAAIMTFVALGLLLYLVVFSNNSMTNRMLEITDRLHYHPIDRIDKTQIESLKDGSTTSGSFVLGSGTIYNEDVYIYYTKTNNGGYIRNHISADKTIIYMDENEHPYLISHYVETDERHVQFINSYSLHVPNNTVQKRFEV